MKNIIAVVNFKGGVGKSTIANLINLPNKIIINLDDAQNAEELNLENSTVNFYELKDEYGIDSLKEAFEGAFESGKENIILDTPGDIKNFIEELTMVDYFIVPFTPGDRSEKTTINTIEIIDALFEEIENRKDKWCLILNKYVNDEQLEELDEIYKKAKNILGNRLICKTHLKYSGVVTTIEKKRISIENLHSVNPIAYGTFKKRVREVNDNIKKMIKE